MAIVLLLAARRLRPWTYQVLVAGGTALITLIVDFSGDGDTAYAMFYIWPSVYSFYFFTRAQAIVQVRARGGAYGGVLALGAAGGRAGRALADHARDHGRRGAR